MLLPAITIVFIVMTVNLFVMLGADQVDCHHMSWLVMSISCTILTAGFVMSGQIIMEKIKANANKQYHYQLLLDSGAQKELDQTYEQLWVLLVVGELWIFHFDISRSMHSAPCYSSCSTCTLHGSL